MESPLTSWTTFKNCSQSTREMRCFLMFFNFFRETKRNSGDPEMLCVSTECVRGWRCRTLTFLFPGTKENGNLIFSTRCICEIGFVEKNRKELETSCDSTLSVLGPLDIRPDFRTNVSLILLFVSEVRNSNITRSWVTFAGPSLPDSNK